jgi:hypothetical protein
MSAKMNWFGIAGGISIFLLIAVSIFVPWWQVTVGNVDQPFANFAVSPLNFNVDFLGQAFTFPLILAINISVVLSLLAGAIAILIYSINPAKPYAQKLLSFSYRKPLYALLIFVVGLAVSILLVKFVAGLDVPLVGALNSKASGSVFQSFLGGISITNVLFTANFQWPFYLAIVSVSLCIVARFYHRKINQLPAAQVNSPSMPTFTTATNTASSNTKQRAN